RITAKGVERVAREGLARITTLALLPDGALLAGGSDGLAVVRGNAVTRVKPLEGRQVSTLFVARDGTIWSGGVGWGGVALREGDEQAQTKLTRAEGLPSDQVNYVYLDSHGTLWVCTDNGAWRRDESGRVSVLDRSHGLPDSFVYWVGEDREGATWLGTN